MFAGEVQVDAKGFFLPFLLRLTVEAGFLGLTLVFAAGLALLFMSPRWKGAVGRLAPLGQMALTWYLFQTMFGIWLFYGFVPGPHLMGKVGRLARADLGGGLRRPVGLAHAWMQRSASAPRNGSGEPHVWARWRP